MKYRKDIDGLRALAVLLVIFCHLGIDGFTGGFLGVDIFFVISGFLITSNIILKLDENRFTFKDFYLNRIKRIAPVLVVFLILLTIFNLLVLLPDPLKNYLEFLPYTAIGLGNYAAANLGHGYFDAVSERYQLLHTWSLGVEEQFYLVVPVLFFLIWKIKSLIQRKIIITGIYLASILISIYYVEFTNEFKSNYYLLHTRFFEIFTGCVLAVFRQDIPRLKSKLAVNIGYLLSIAGIFYCSYTYGEHSSWPGINALFVSGITALIIFLGSDSNVITKLGSTLKAKHLRFIGKISYSLYLWHWVIIATLIELGYDVKSFWLPLKMSLLLFIMIPLSYLSWQHVENRFRYRSTYNFKTSLGVWVLLPLLTAYTLSKTQEKEPSFFYNELEIDNTSYKYSYENSPHVRIKSNILTKEARQKFKGSEYFVGDFAIRRNELRTNPLGIEQAEVLILTNSHFHAFKKFVHKQLKDKNLLAHVLHESTPRIYGEPKAPEIYSKLLENKKFLVLWVRPKMMKLGKTEEDWHFWIIQKAIEMGIQPIVYVTGLETENEQEARRYIYDQKLFGRTLSEIGNKAKVYSNIEDLDYVQRLFDQYKNKVRWIDFKHLMCNTDTCQLWSDKTFVLFDKHHLARTVGERLGEEYAFRYDNIFSENWVQPQVSIKKEYFEPSKSKKDGQINFSRDGYKIRLDLQNRTCYIEKELNLSSDKGSMFFFHVIPQNMDELNKDRKKHGFDNLDVMGKDLTYFKDGKSIYFGKNVLPEYKIGSIKVGHFKPKGKKYFETSFVDINK